MKILKLLNKKYFSIVFILFFSLTSFAEDQPVDIWNIEKEITKNKKKTDEILSIEDTESSIISETDI